MNEVIVVDPSKCVGCNACVRNCPAPEANLTKQLADGRFVTTVNPEKCITCGECVRTCEHGARDYIDDTREFMDILGQQTTIVLVTPAIKSVFPTKWKSILDFLRTKKCLIYDVSLGADICTWAHLRAIEQKKVGNIITQPCAAIVKYIEMYQPKLLNNLVPIHSPISCAAVYIKKYLNRNEDIAVLSPCIAKKQEFNETNLVRYNVTFKKLMEQLNKNNVTLPVHQAHEYDYNFDGGQGQVGSIYPRPGGLRDNVWLHNPDINITTSEGVHKVYPELDMYAQMPEYKHPEVFDVLSCEFGCNIGPASGTTQTVFDVMATMRDVEKDAKKRRKQKGLFRQGEDKLFEKFDNELELQDFMRQYMRYEQSPEPSEEQLDAIFLAMGKHTAEDRKLNCHACGYKSCRAMATAIFRGLNTADNCVVHSKSVLLARHSKLSEQHERLSEIQERCLAISESLVANNKKITDSIKSIGKSSNASEERANVVNELINNVVKYCESNKEMNESTVNQLIDILKTTADAFGALNLHINNTKSSSLLIEDSVSSISNLIDELDDVLHNTK